MDNVNTKGKTMGEVQNKLFNMDSCILNDIKGEIYIGKSIEEPKIIFIKRRKK